jgi:hypothetical protein
MNSTGGAGESQPLQSATSRDGAKRATSGWKPERPGAEPGVSRAGQNRTPVLTKRCPSCRYAFDAKTWRCPRCAAELETINSAPVEEREEQDEP